jgi:hypothetical protein
MIIIKIKYFNFFGAEKFFSTRLLNHIVDSTRVIIQLKVLKKRVKSSKLTLVFTVLEIKFTS